MLYTLKYSDSSLIVHTFTEEHGRMAFWLRISKTHKAKVQKVLFQPLSVLDLDIDVPQKGGLSYIRDARAACPFGSLPFDPLKLSVALFIAEFLGRVLKEEDQNQPLFSYLESSIRWLDGCQEVPANFHLVFLMHLSLFMGLYPNLDDYHEGDFFDLENGCFCTPMPIHGQFVRSPFSGHIRTLMRMNYENMHLFKMNRTDRNEILDVLLRYYGIHIPGSAELKSLPVLKELFD